MNYIDIIATDIWSVSEGGEVLEYVAPLYRIYAVLALVKGTATTMEDVHDAWCAWKTGIDNRHRHLVPFDQLTPEVQALDRTIMDAIHYIAMRLPPRGQVVIRTEVV